MFRRFIFILSLISAPALTQARIALTEAEVIRLALRQNLALQAALYGPKIAETEVTRAKSQFDTQLSGQVFYNLDRGDKESIVFGTDNREIFYEARVEKKFPVGVDGAISFSNDHTSTNSAFATEPSFFDTRLRFEANAPMLRNRFGVSDRNAVELSRYQAKVSSAQAGEEMQTQVERAVTQYWNWVAAKEFLETTRSFLKLARDFEGSTQVKKGLGLSEDADLFGTQALVVERQTEVLRAQNLVDDIALRLKNTLDLPSSETIETKDTLKVRGHDLSLEESVAIALARRPDYLALIEEARAKDIQLAISRDQKLPGLDLFSSLELNSVDPSYGEALKQTYGFQHPNWFIGARFNLSLENRLAKASLTRAELGKARVLVLIKELENRIALEIDERIRELKLQKKEFENYSRAADLQKRKLDSELGNFFYGRSSSDTIIRFQDDYLVAAKKALEAEVRMQIAWVDLRRSLAVLIPPQIRSFDVEVAR